MGRRAVHLGLVALGLLLAWTLGGCSAASTSPAASTPLLRIVPHLEGKLTATVWQTLTPSDSRQACDPSVAARLPQPSASNLCLPVKISGISGTLRNPDAYSLIDLRVVALELYLIETPEQEWLLARYQPSYQTSNTLVPARLGPREEAGFRVSSQESIWLPGLYRGEPSDKNGLNVRLRLIWAVSGDGPYVMVTEPTIVRPRI